VTVLVGTTHDEFAYSNNDVFVEYYADWCPHCKDLAPIWEKLAADLKTVEGLKFAKMLATDNETAFIHPKGYPTIALFSENLAFGAKPTIVSGRDYDSLLAKAKATASYKRHSGEITEL
jgi:protein disulfide-isomerase A1